MLLSSMTGVPHLVALAAVLAAAITLRLAWGKLFVHGREPGAMDRWLAEYTATPVFLLVMAVGAEVILARLAELPPVARLSVTRYALGAAYVFTVLSSTWVVYALVRGVGEWYMSRFTRPAGSAVDAELIPAFRLVVKVVLIFVAGTMVLGHYDVDIKALLGAAGAASLILALGAQATIANMVAGFTILVDRPFRLGDRVELPDGRSGDVQEIGLRSTKILSPDFTLYIIPNSELAKSSVVNYSYPTDRMNVRQKLAVPYGSDIARVKRILIESCREHSLVLPDPPPNAQLSQLGDSGVQVSFNFWIDDFRTKGRIADEIHMAVYARLEQEGIRIFPPRQVELLSQQ